ncbi:MAG TPA: VanZ family protein [Pyrinomonadaceae bacterium]|nr:VanZ family protein [Pyrinomonadaceae bacterium]
MRSSKSSPERPPSRTISRYLPLILWMAFISFASTGNFSAGNTSRIIGPLVLWLFPNTTPETLLVIHGITRKLAHFTEYAVLGILAARAFRGSPRPMLRDRWFLLSLVLVVVYALVDEYHQSFVPSRTGTIYDSLIDMAGGLMALIVVSRRGWFERASNSPV